MRNDREFAGCGRRMMSEGAPGVPAALLGDTPVYARDRAFETVHVSLDLEVDLARKRLAGTCATTVRAVRAGVRKVEFDAVDLKVSKVSVDGAKARFENKGGRLTVHLPAPLSESADTVVETTYAVEKPKSGLHFVYPGPHNRENPVQMWSQSQPEDAKRWFPCRDFPGEKTTSEVRAVVPAGFVAVSNGVLLDRSKRGAKEAFHWRMDRRHSIYLITLAVGRFAEIEEEWDGIPIVYYCEKGREADAKRGFAKTAAAMKLFSEKTGVRYPYARYAQVAVAEYPGGMEHTTATTQTDACLIDAQAHADHDLDTLVAHELAHQWFGDLVTCREWSHAWLNEGFATYMEVVFLESDKGRDDADFELLNNARVYFDEDSRRYRRSIVTRHYKDPWTIFDRHLYEKGAWVLRMLHAELGDELWWKAVRHWLTKHRDQSVETAQFVRAIEEATGRDLSAFFDQWVFRAGYPHLKLRWAYDLKTRKGELWVLQTQEVSEKHPAYRLKAKVRVTGRDWHRDFTEHLAEKEHRFVWTLPGEPLDVTFDPDFELLYKADFHKPLAMWLHQLAKAPKAVHRALAAASVARWGGETAVAALAAAIKRERHWNAAAEMVDALASVAGESSLAALRSLLKTLKHPKALRAAVEALGRRGDASDARSLAPLARSARSLLVRAEATRALGQLDGRRHRAVIDSNLTAKTYRDGVAAAAVSAVAASRDPKAVARLARLARPPYRFGARLAAVRALSSYASASRDAVPALLALLPEPDERVSLVVIAALGAAGDEHAIPVLEKTKKETGNPRVRVYVDEALARLKAGGKTRSKLLPKTR
ncbi:MAG: M1 family metallopeptidase [Elusimicrobiota bacterium]|nr:M1 family metallopeptidase [Elusimicrobiota bacterium]